MPKVAFSKYHGLGNDFILLENTAMDSKLAANLCTRRFGIGADGVIVIDTQKDAPYISIWNSDGSQSEMCGNGIRCVADYLLREKIVRDDEFEIGTDAGPHEISFEEDGEISVLMRPYSISPTEIGLRSNEGWIAKDVTVGGRDIKLTAISMGNPHVVTFDGLDDSPNLAEPISKFQVFDKGVNVGFANIIDDGLELRVYERGAGWTYACGTGACAAVAAAAEIGKLEHKTPTKVKLPGGVLTITTFGRDKPVRMKGPATFVYAGEFQI